MKYISTRGKAPVLNFEEVLLAGLASDGGLYVPETLPQFSPAKIASFSKLSYQDLAYEVISPFVSGEIAEKDLRKIIEKSYANFNHEAIAPLKQLAKDEWLLELFHGPTLAFKDFALQMLGNFLDYFLEKRKEKIIIVGATSGDTGSAAIEGCRLCKNVDIFILHPNNKTSEIQRRQMTTTGAKNVYNIAIDGTFDDCQDMVKELFADRSFINHRLVAVNSINWARIMAQIVYYFYAAIRLGSPAKAVSFAVPTGNFGDIFAGFIAYKMGLPVEKLIIATNANDILARFINFNLYEKKGVKQTLSPSMDIQVSSNFERLLFYAHDFNGEKISQLMDDFKKTGKLKIEEGLLNEIKRLFLAEATDDSQTAKTIAAIYENTGEIIDPHTATGVRAAKELGNKLNSPVITLATAHPAKFPEAIKKSGIGKDAESQILKGIFQKKEVFTVLKNDITAIKEFIRKNV